MYKARPQSAGVKPRKWLWLALVSFPLKKESFLMNQGWITF